MSGRDPVGKRILGVTSLALITAGFLVLVDVALTLTWKEPLSSVWGALQQDEAENSFRALSERFDDPDPSGRSTIELRAAADRLEQIIDSGEVASGDGIGRIEIPAVGAEYVFVQGTDNESLRKGPGHYESTPLPGSGGTVGIAGHRTTYGAPFRRIDDVDAGDEIVVEMPYATLTYATERTLTVSPADTSVLDDAGHERLVLTTCHPPLSAAERYVVMAELVDVSAPAA